MNKVTLEKGDFFSFFDNLARECSDANITVDDCIIKEGTFICERCGKDITSEECCRDKIEVFVDRG